MKSLLTVLLSGCVLSTTAIATVIDFNSPTDLTDHFAQTGVNSTFWQYQPSIGLNGSGGLAGHNGGSSGYLVYQQGQQLAATGQTQISGGIFMQLSSLSTEISGFQLAIGLAPTAETTAPQPLPKAQATL